MEKIGREYRKQEISYLESQSIHPTLEKKVRVWNKQVEQRING